MTKSNFPPSVGILASIILICLVSACLKGGSSTSSQTTQAQATTFPTSTGIVTFNGFITCEDDFADPQIGADPSKDTKPMILMEAMALSGLGIAVHETNGWKFYYLSGEIATTINPVFNGTGGQLDAWNIVLNTKKQDHLSVKVTGFLDGASATNPGGDADGIYYPVITVNSIVET